MTEWHEKGGIVGRGVLIDFVAYANRHGVKYDAEKYFPIRSRDLGIAASEQGVALKQGDILLVRTGFRKWYNECTNPEERKRWFLDDKRESIGVVPDDETVRWMWEHRFSAVAGDNLAWEAMPMPNDVPCEFWALCRKTRELLLTQRASFPPTPPRVVGHTNRRVVGS